MDRMQYYLSEAWASLRRGGASNVIAIGTIALALFVVGAFLLVTSSLDRLMTGWGAAAELSVYLHEDATPDERAGVEAALAASRAVERSDFVSKDEAGRRFRREFPDLASTADAVGSNPFPASVEARLRPRAWRSPEVTRLARDVARMPGVADVRYDRQWLERLGRLIAIVRGVGLGLGLALAVAAALCIAAVVRLTMYGRRDEVEIMELVGAPMSAIRGPFILEGVLQGGLGALVAIGALGGAFEIVRARVGTDLAAVAPMLVQFLSLAASVGLVAGGAIVGCIGGYLATRAVR